jgi:hypothetical protein
MRHRQLGMTFLGGLVLIIVVGSWVYVGIRLTPVYLNYMKVASTLEKVRDEYASNPSTTEFMVQKAIERHWDIEMISGISHKDVKVKRQGDTFTMNAAYEEQIHLVANVSLLAQFDKTVDIPVR